MFPCFGTLFPEIALGDGPKNWHIFLFSVEYWPSYWHMPIQLSIIRKPSWHSIYTCYFNFLVRTGKSPVFFLFFPEIALGEDPRNSRIRVNENVKVQPCTSQNRFFVIDKTNRIYTLFKVNLTSYTQNTCMYSISIIQWPWRLLDGFKRLESDRVGLYRIESSQLEIVTVSLFSSS